MPGFILPPRSEVGYLSPELEEGEKVILSNGDQVSWTPPPAKLSMPDWSQIKSIAKYFNRRGGPPFPAWIYHPVEDDVLVKDAAEAEKYGVIYRRATNDERDRGMPNDVWDWVGDSKWRSRPQKPRKFDPNKMDAGKTYVASQNPVRAQHDLIESLIPAVAAAVALSLKANGPSAPANIDAKQWEAFLAFQAFQKTTETVNALAAETEEDEDREAWEDKARRLNIKVDGRWSLERLKSEVQKAA